MFLNAVKSTLQYFTVCVYSSTVYMSSLPVGRPHEGVGWGHDGGGAKVSQFDLTRLRQQDVSCFHIPAGDNETRSHAETQRKQRITPPAACVTHQHPTARLKRLLFTTEVKNK